MGDCRLFVLVLLVALNKHSYCLDWSDWPQDNDVLSVCVGDDVTFPWDFRTAPNEEVQNVTWEYETNSTSKLIAFYSSGENETDELYSHRVSYESNGSLSMTNVTMKDSGMYNISVETQDQHGVGRYQRSVALQVKDSILTKDRKVHVRQEGGAKWDNTTSTFTLTLSCGTFRFTDQQPSLQVEWSTPTGDTLNSTDYSNGRFYLSLLAPVVGGTYTCRIPPQHLSRTCLTDSRHDNNFVRVDSIQINVLQTIFEHKTLPEEAGKLKGRIANLDAEDEKRKAEDEKLKAEDKKLKAEIKKLKAKDEKLKAKDEKLNAEDEKLKAEDGKLKAENEKLKAENGKLKAEDEKLKAEDEKLKAEVEKLKAENEKLTAEDEKLKAENEKLKAEDEKLKAEDKKLKAEDEKLKAEDDKLKAEDEKLNAENKKLKAEDEKLKAEDKKLKAEDKKLKAEDEKLKAEDKKLKAEDEKLKAEDKKLKAEDEKLKLEHQKLKAEDEKLKSEDEKLKAAHEKLKAEDGKLKAENEKLKAEDEKLKAEIKNLKAEDEKLKTNDEKLKAEDDKLKAEDDKLKAEDESLKAEIDKLKAEDKKLLSQITKDKCPRSWTLHGESCYKYIGVATTWQNAQVQCESMEARLVEIDSQAENSFVFNMVVSEGAGYAWLGLSDVGTEGLFLLPSGRPPTFTKWGPGEPNNSGFRGRQDCATFWSDGPDFADRWDDAHCDDDKPFVCEQYEQLKAEDEKLKAEIEKLKAEDEKLLSQITKVICPRSWTLHGESCYKYISTATTWQNAQVECESMEARLVEIDSQAENSFVFNMVDSEGAVQAWLGLSDIGEEGLFLLPSGQPPAFTKWRPEQPNNLGGREDCAVFWTDRANFADHWNDAACYEDKPFVCEQYEKLKAENEKLKAEDEKIKDQNRELQSAVDKLKEEDGKLKNLLARITKVVDKCPRSWTLHGESCYKYISAATTWQNAQVECESMEARLVEIDSEAENSFVFNIVDSEGGWHAWLGLSDVGVEGLFLLPSGQPPTFTKWGPGEPNDSRGREDCAEFLKKRWNDVPCDIDIPFVCEQHVLF